MAKVGAADGGERLDAEAVPAAAGRAGRPRGCGRARPGGGPARPSDELWAELTELTELIELIELIELDVRFGDRVWDGTIPLDEGPPWTRRVGTLVATARAPALPDELEREAEILAEMAKLLAASGASGDER